MLNKITRAASLLSLGLLILLVLPPQAKAISLSQSSASIAPAIANFSMVTPGLFRGAYPSYEGLSQLKAAGVKTDISLDNESGLLQQEQEAASKLGLNFVSIPLSPFHKPTESEISQFLSTVESEKEKNEPVYVHCHHGQDRTGAMVGIYRVVEQGWPADRAYQEMLSHGFHSFFFNLSRAVFDCDPGERSGAHQSPLLSLARNFSFHFLPRLESSSN